MDNMYLVLVIVLFALAFSDLIVGVSNDAVNFLNSAIGSKVAPRYVIMILASLGILVGATFSSGMMEVARKGIFFPDQFYFSNYDNISGGYDSRCYPARPI
jgi:phosphate/sulfate permease